MGGYLLEIGSSSEKEAIDGMVADYDHGNYYTHELSLMSVSTLTGYAYVRSCVWL